jgi:hypothetical protein
MRQATRLGLKRVDWEEVYCMNLDTTMVRRSSVLAPEERTAGAERGH